MRVAEAVPDFAAAFPFDEFNRMQREALPALLERDANVVASAPTASGKTALAELAICKTLRDGGTALFIAPLRALTNEKEREWERFEALGHTVYVVTGERDLNPRRAARADVLVMTPEKVDSATRKHDSERYGFITDVDACVIDEVHLLDSDTRGSVLEVTVARLRRLCDPRVVALSATMPNIEDVAGWLDAPPECTFSFGEAYRPVDLTAGVRTYTHGENAFADKYRRLYRALDLAEPHIRDDGQALVFVSSRQDTVQAARKAREELTDRGVPLGARGDYDVHEATRALSNDTLREFVLDGVGFHHAGLSKTDKDLVERWFRQGTVSILFSTSTLAWGVNLPARCVVIRDTKLHDPLEGAVEMSPVDVLQMLGRAGRPDYDDVGYAWVICDAADADRYRRLLDDGTPLESQLADDLDAHLVAEVALGTIRSVDDVLAWLETTFYYVRAQAAPDRYGTADLRERIRDALDGLVDRGFITRDGEAGLTVTPLGELSSAYYLELETAKRFQDLVRADRFTRESVLRAIARAAEFDNVSARRDERDAIHAVVPADADLDAGVRKVLAILRSSVDGSVPEELRGDAWVIRQNARRLLGALRAFVERFGTPRQANVLCRLGARLEHGVTAEAVGLTAIEGVGAERADTLAVAGIQTPADVIASGVDGLVDAGLSSGVANRVYDAADGLPIVDVDWGSFPARIDRGDRAFHSITVRLDGARARIGVRVTVNEVEMTAKAGYADGELSVPVGVYGTPETDELTFTVEVTFPELPLRPIEHRRQVSVG